MTDTLRRRVTAKMRVMDIIERQWSRSTQRPPRANLTNVYLCSPACGGLRGIARLWELSEDGLIEYSYTPIEEHRDTLLYTIIPGHAHDRYQLTHQIPLLGGVA